MLAAVPNCRLLSLLRNGVSFWQCGRNVLDLVAFLPAVKCGNCRRGEYANYSRPQSYTCNHFLFLKVKSVAAQENLGSLCHSASVHLSETWNIHLADTCLSVMRSSYWTLLLITAVLGAPGHAWQVKLLKLPGNQYSESAANP